jgi:hypothetical protein
VALAAAISAHEATLRCDGAAPLLAECRNTGVAGPKGAEVKERLPAIKQSDLVSELGSGELGLLHWYVSCDLRVPVLGNRMPAQAHMG